MNTGKPKDRKRIHKLLGDLRDSHSTNCWVCGSHSGIKTCREGYGTRCKRCIEDGKTNNDVQRYDNLKKKLKGKQ